MDHFHRRQKRSETHTSPLSRRSARPQTETQDTPETRTHPRNTKRKKIKIHKKELKKHSTPRNRNPRNSREEIKHETRVPRHDDRKASLGTDAQIAPQEEVGVPRHPKPRKLGTGTTKYETRNLESGTRNLEPRARTPNPRTQIANPIPKTGAICVQARCRSGPLLGMRGHFAAQYSFHVPHGHSPPRRAPREGAFLISSIRDRAIAAPPLRWLLSAV